MTPENTLVLAILGIAIILFATEKVRVDVVALIVLLALVVTGLLTPEEAFAGFANPAVVTVWAIYMVSASLTHTGIADFIGRYIGRFAGSGEQRLILVIMVTAASMSAFMNNIGAAAVLLPVAIGLSEKTSVPASKLLIPLAFGSLLGGVTTLIGTPPNLLASDALTEVGLSGFNLFDFTAMGLIILISSIAYMALIGRHLLPSYQRATHAKHPDLTTEYRLREKLTELKVAENSALIGKTMVESQLGEDFDLTVVGLRRNGRWRLGLLPNAHIQAGDSLLVRGAPPKVERARHLMKLEPIPDSPSDQNLISAEATVAELVISQKAHFIGQSLREMDFRGRYGLSALAIWREEAALAEPIADVPLHLGDTLLVHGRRERIEAIRDDISFLLLRAPKAPNRRLGKAPLNIAIFVSMISLVGFGVLHISVAAVLGAVLSILTGCLTMEEAYESVEWKSVFLIAGMLPLGIAMAKTGTAQHLADGIIGIVGDLGPRGVLVGLFVLTTILTAFMSNAAAAVLVAPIAIQTAFRLGVSPHAFVMGVAIAASNSFVTPIGHQACVLVYGPGGYRFFDYAKVGLPLTIMIWILMTIFLPVFWPFG